MLEQAYALSTLNEELEVLSKSTASTDSRLKELSTEVQKIVRTRTEKHTQHTEDGSIAAAIYFAIKPKNLRTSVWVCYGGERKHLVDHGYERKDRGFF